MVNNVGFINFTTEGNIAVNKALGIANKQSVKVNAIHMLLAILDGEHGNNILSKLGITIDTLYEVLNDAYNGPDIGFEPIEDSQDIGAIFTNTSYCALIDTTMRGIQEQKMVGPRELLWSLCNVEESAEELEEFFSVAGIEINSITDLYKLSEEILSSSIPYSLRSVLTDMNSETDKNAEQIFGVDEYTTDMIEVLGRKNKANPCLIGEAGVGKTTVVRRFVQRILNKDVPADLLDVHVYNVSVGELSAGTAMRGAFEEKIGELVEWAKDRNRVLFIDELHTFIKAGSGGGEAGAGNLIKQALATGDIRVISATTIEEYHKYIEKDKAFSRRLQEIVVREPSVKDTIKMVYNTISNYEEFHNIEYPLECIEDTVKLSHRYIKSKKFPDKAYTIVDQTASYVKLQGKKVVGIEDVLRTISKLSGVDIKSLSEDELDRLSKLEETLSKKIIGQSEAIKTVSKAVRRAKAGVREEGKPIASFLFVGPTGVGKTELCKVLNDEVNLGSKEIIKLDMSEYSEKHTVSKLIGTAPGYIGYGEGGGLTEKVKHNPNSLILFDEIEKAHPEIYNVMLQILDEGRLTDGEGETVDFTNCIIVLTSNAGYEANAVKHKTLGFGDRQKEFEAKTVDVIKKVFKPEFINRLDNVVTFNKLSRENTKEITKIMLDKLAKRVEDNRQIKLRFSKSIEDLISNKGFSEEYGARNLKRVIQDNLEDIISDKIIGKEFKSKDIVTIGCTKNYKINTKVKRRDG